MSHFRIASGWTMTAAMVCVFAVSILAIRAAEPPASVEPGGKPIAPAEQKIRDALEGDLSAGETGDGVLDDVLGIIKQRRSILEGSSLDPIHNDSETKGGPHSVSKMALAAEQMLKAARLLENVGSPDQDRADLVTRMRAEAVKLLSE